MSWPSISVVIATYNSAKTLKRTLKDIRLQDYPQPKIEIVLGDGGSSDDTLKLAKDYKAKVIKVPPHLQHAEYNRGVAFNKAKNELALILDHDNFLPHKKWLQKMIKPLVENKQIIAVQTCFYDYRRNYGLMDRYFALFGTSEPLPYFLHKADRMPWGDNNWTLQGESQDMGDYFLVRFGKDPRKIPSIGTNGCLMRRELVVKNACADPLHHYPVDVMVDVIKKDYNQFGFIKDSLIHLTHSRGFIDFIKRRKKFVEQYHFQDQNKRRWSVVMPGDEIGVLSYVIYSLTIVGPLYHSFKGFFRVQDIAWFVHPLMCIGTTLIYGYVSVKYFLLRKLSNI